MTPPLVTILVPDDGYRFDPIELGVVARQAGPPSVPTMSIESVATIVATPQHPAAPSADEVRGRLTRLAEAASRARMVPIVKGKSFAQPGQRNSELYRAACILAGCAPDATTDVLVEVLRSSLETMRAEHDDPANPAMTIDDARKMIERALEWARAEKRTDASAFANLIGTPDSAARPRNSTPGSAPRARIVVTTDIDSVANQTEAALLNLPGVVYSRGGVLVHTVVARAQHTTGLTREDATPIIVLLPRAHLRELCSRAADFAAPPPKTTKNHAVAAPRLTLPPMWVVETIPARGQWRFPELEGVSETPIFRPDGSILDLPGYDSPSRMLYAPGDTIFPPVPPTPTKDDAESAYKTLIAPFADFPFVSPAHAAVVVALILSIIARPAIRGPVPLFAVRAPAPGSGKGLIIDAATIIATGRCAPRMIAPRNDDEAQKRLVAIGLEGDATVLLDNVEGTFGSPALAAALTGEALKDRLLGSSTMVTVALRTVWTLTGNNVVFAGDLGRRVVPCTIDPKCEHPEDRSGFRNDDLRAYVREQRPSLVVAALTLLRGFHLAGRPSHGKPRKGSFEAWDDLVRAAVIWASGEDPLAGCAEIRQESDADRAVLGAVLFGWHGCFGSQDKTVADAIAHASSAIIAAHSTGATLATNLAAASLREALAALDPMRKSDRLDPGVIGRRLHSLKGRMVAGKYFERAGTLHGVAKWRVVEGIGPMNNA